jgi:hypothetical protein
VNEEQLDRIEAAYETKIGTDAKVIRLLLEEIRRLQQELEELKWSAQ